MTGCDLFQALISGCKLARADLREGELSGVDLKVLGSLLGMKVTASQQYGLLSDIGIDVRPD